MGKQIGSVNTANAFVVRPNPDLVEPKFLGFAVESSISRGSLKRLEQGTAQQFIRKNDVNNLKIESLGSKLGDVAQVSTIRSGQQLKKGDILISNSGTVGNMEVLDEDIEAKHGFMGMVNKKTRFTVGEKGKKEHVRRKKSNDYDFMQGMKF